jgi:hypothetical protein
MSMTNLEIDDAVREAWRILYAEPTASPLERRLAAALLAVTGGTQTHPHWITPDDLWHDRLAVLAEQGAWLTAWGPRPGEQDCQVPHALLPESQTRRENAYLLWRSEVRTNTEVTSKSKAPHTRAVRFPRQTDAGEASPERPKTQRGKLLARKPDVR